LYRNASNILSLKQLSLSIQHTDNVPQNIPLLASVFFLPEFRGYTDKELEVDAGHWSGQHRKIILVEKVVYGKFQLNISRLEEHVFLKRDVAHKVFG
jgi:hypothetical protein